MSKIKFGVKRTVLITLATSTLLAGILIIGLYFKASSKVSKTSNNLVSEDHVPPVTDPVAAKPETILEPDVDWDEIIDAQKRSVVLNEEKILELTNQKRIENGVNPFKTGNIDLCRMAEESVAQFIELGRLPTDEEYKNAIEEPASLSDTKTAHGINLYNEEQAVDVFFNDESTNPIFISGELVWACVRSEQVFVVLTTGY